MAEASSAQHYDSLALVKDERYPSSSTSSAEKRGLSNDLCK